MKIIRLPPFPDRLASLFWRVDTILIAFAIVLGCVGLFYLAAPLTYNLTPQAGLVTGNGYLITGQLFEARRWFYSNFSYFLFKTNDQGELVWYRHAPFNPRASGIANALDGYFLLLTDHLAKFDDSGHELWNKKLGGITDFTYGISGGHHKIIKNHDGTCLIVARDESEHLMVLKVSGEGSILWSRKYDGEKIPNIAAAKGCNDGGYIILTQVDVGEKFQAAAKVFKLSGSGERLWQLRVADETEMTGLHPVDIAEDNNGRLVFLGFWSAVVRGSTAQIGNNNHLMILLQGADGVELARREFGFEDPRPALPKKVFYRSDGRVVVVSSSSAQFHFKIFADSSLKKVVDTRKTGIEGFTEVFDVLSSGDSFIVVTNFTTPEEFLNGFGGRVRLYNVSPAGEVKWVKDITHQ